MVEICENHFICRIPVPIKLISKDLNTGKKKKIEELPPEFGFQLFPKLVVCITICFQTLNAHSPAAFKTLATIHSQRARALANALNLRARAQYNAALARSRTPNFGLSDHRFVRDCNRNLDDEENSLGGAHIPRMVWTDFATSARCNFQENYISAPYKRSSGAILGDAEPHLHDNKHTLGHFKRIQTAQVMPTRQIVTPRGHNVPQFASATIHPGLNTAVLSPPVMVHHSGGVHSDGGVVINGHTMDGLPHGGMMQTQGVQTHSTPFLGGGGIIQSKNSHQVLMEGEPPGGDMNMYRDASTQKLERLINIPSQKTPQFSDYSNMNGPQNRQSIVDYLETEQIPASLIVPSAEEKRIHPLFKNTATDQLAQPNFENERLGTFFLDNSQLEPIPPLPPNFVELDPDHRREMVSNILDTERRNLQNIVDQIDHHEHKNINNFERIVADEFGTIDERIVKPDPQNFQDSINQQDPSLFDNQDNVFGHNDMQPDSGERLGTFLELPSEGHEISEMLAQLIENNPEQMGLAPPEVDSTLGYLFQVPDRHFSEDFYRQARATNVTKKRIR
ncbi:hypothetical protein NQ317_018841 [Molorchus minor]|uniref:Uncharacterized protein n=1 Tax=Molorchus minor TaxID=1323400 RepID=A0ABQ9J684_9CUCU|nr:hypothetical protein NQ317_018841 [Molorchus minor]